MTDESPLPSARLALENARLQSALSYWEKFSRTALHNMEILRGQIKDNHPEAPLPLPPGPVPAPDSLEARVSRLEERNKMIGTLILTLFQEIVKDVEPGVGPTPIVVPY